MQLASIFLACFEFDPYIFSFWEWMSNLFIITLPENYPDNKPYKSKEEPIMDASVGASSDQISQVTIDVLAAILLSSVWNRGVAQCVQNPYET